MTHTYCFVYDSASQMFLSSKLERRFYSFYQFFCKFFIKTSFYKYFMLSCCFEMLTSTDVSIRMTSYRKRTVQFQQAFHCFRSIQSVIEQWISLVFVRRINENLDSLLGEVLDLSECTTKSLSCCLTTVQVCSFLVIQRQNVLDGNSVSTTTVQVLFDNLRYIRVIVITHKFDTFVPSSK